MTPNRRAFVGSVVAAAAFLLALPAHGQNRDNCKKLKGNPKLITDCVEALFSQDPVHLTISSVPPGNGLAVGIVADQQKHYLTTFAAPEQPDFDPDSANRDGKFERRASLGLVDSKLAFIGTTNLSWVATGSISWLPAAYGSGQRTDLHGVAHDCNKLGILCTTRVLALHFEGTHQHLNTISFYGLGAKSPGLKHTYPQNNTYGEVDGSLPLTDWLTADGGVQVLAPTLPPSSDPLAVSNTFSNAQAPGLASQPTFAHSHAGLSTRAMFDWNPVTNDADDNATGPLMKKNLLFVLNNTVEYHWYAGSGASQYSFQQFVFNADETVRLGSNVRRVIRGNDAKGGLKGAYYHLLRRACGETDSLKGYDNPVLLKVHDQCDYGTLDVRASVVASRTGARSVIPFYLQPTVGGSNFYSQVSLRGYPNYRFRDRDATFSQVEYSVPIRDPFGLLVFYDAGTVGPTVGSLSFAHLRQDGGVGTVLRIKNTVMGQAYVAWGAGHGPTLGYNLAKLF